MFKKSNIDSDVRFTLKDNAQSETMKIRKKYLKETSMLWINKPTIVDNFGELHQPQSLILIWLN